MVLKGRPAISEIAGLFRATRGGVFGIEIDHHALAPQGGQVHGLSVLVRKCEIRREIADLQSHGGRQQPERKRNRDVAWTGFFKGSMGVRSGTSLGVQLGSGPSAEFPWLPSLDAFVSW